MQKKKEKGKIQVTFIKSLNSHFPKQYVHLCFFFFYSFVTKKHQITKDKDSIGEKIIIVSVYTRLQQFLFPVFRVIIQFPSKTPFPFKIFSSFLTAAAAQ